LNDSRRTVAPAWGASTISPGPTTMPTWPTCCLSLPKKTRSPRRERLARLQVRAGVVLLLGNARQRDPGRLVGGLHEAGTIEAARSLAAPQVRAADLGKREADRDRRRRCRCAGSVGAELGRVGRRPAQHRVDVSLRVVVGEDRAADVGGCAGRFQVVGGREDRVGGIPAVGAAVAVGVDAVAGPGRGQELHRPAGAGLVDGAALPAGGGGGAAVVAFDLANPGEHRPRHAVGDACLLVEEQVVGRDVGERDLRRRVEAAAAADRAAGGGEHEHRQEQADSDRDQRQPLHAACSCSAVSSAGSLVTSACSSGLATIFSGIRSSPATRRPEPVGQASR
jgi:hypothetical protein